MWRCANANLPAVPAVTNEVEALSPSRVSVGDKEAGNLAALSAASRHEGHRTIWTLEGHQDAENPGMVQMKSLWPSLIGDPEGNAHSARKRQNGIAGFRQRSRLAAANFGYNRPPRASASLWKGSPPASIPPERCNKSPIENAAMMFLQADLRTLRSQSILHFVNGVNRTARMRHQCGLNFF